MPSRSVLRGLLIIFSLAASLWGCAKRHSLDPGADAAGVDDCREAGPFSDGPARCTDPNADEDGDKIPNGLEGCRSGLDTDGDGMPDWLDFDSDGDGLLDSVERGERDASGSCKQGGTWPCDSDGDGLPDFQDTDSDGDGLGDGWEDYNHDGLLGCCLSTCKKTGSHSQNRCTLTADGCGPGQSCKSGVCQPSVDMVCAQGETSPKKAQTFGFPDSSIPLWVCRLETVGKKGIPSLRVKYSTTGDWNVALEKNVRYAPLSIAGGTSKMVAAAIDHDQAGEQVAGFVVSLDSSGEIQADLRHVISRIQARMGAGAATGLVRTWGVQGKTHDLFDIVRGTVLDIPIPDGARVPSVRDTLLAAVLDRSLSALSGLPPHYGDTHTGFVVRFSTVRRFSFKKSSSVKRVLDSKGYPTDSGDKNKWRLLLMGAVTGRTSDDDSARRTRIISEDLSGGTALADLSGIVTTECDCLSVSRLPEADIIWVVDASDSMKGARQVLAGAGSSLFSAALATGLDLRMGVTGMCDPAGASATKVGRLCSGAGGGTADRFLQPQEQSVFSTCLQDPQGGPAADAHGLSNVKAAVTTHLPRAGNDPGRIRTQASLHIIVASDRVPAELAGLLGASSKSTCSLDATTQGKLEQSLAPMLDLLGGTSYPEASATFHMLGGLCSGACSSEVGHGYLDLTRSLGGQAVDLCHASLTTALQAVVDQVVGQASPLTLDHAPISATLNLALDFTLRKRSRTEGFDYYPGANTLAFHNLKYSKGSVVLVGYWKWEQQLLYKMRAPRLW